MISLHQGIEQAWGRLERVATLSCGPDVLRAEPRDRRGWYSWTTVGLGDACDGLELLTYSVDDEEWPVALLEAVAATALASDLVRPHQALDLGGPLDGEDSSLTSALLLPPYMEPDWLWTSGDQPGGWLLWVLPVTAAERDYAVLAGGRALEALLFDSSLRPAPDLQRASLV